MNVPSYNALLNKETLIKVIKELCEKVNSFEKNSVTKEDLQQNQVAVVAEQPIPNTWPIGSQHSMADLIEAINNDTTAIPGRMYLSTVSLNDLPNYDDNGTPEKLIQAEMKVEIMAQDIIPNGNSGSQIAKVILFTVTSTLPPYHWEYTSAWRQTGQWVAFETA